MRTLKEILTELILIRKELQAIRRELELEIDITVNRKGIRTKNPKVFL